MLALRADLDVGSKGKSRGDQLVLDLAAERLEPSLDKLGDIFAGEEIREIRIHTVATQVHELTAHDRNPGRAQHVRLDGDVRNVLLLAHGGLRFHLDEDESAIDAFQNVRKHEGVLCDHRAFVDGGHRRIGESFTALSQDDVHAASAPPDQASARDIAARESSDFRALVHSESRDESCARFRRRWIVHLPPHALETLRAGEECLLGECVVVDHRVNSRCRYLTHFTCTFTAIACGVGDIWFDTTK